MSMPSRGPVIRGCGCKLPAGVPCAHQKAAAAERKARHDQRRPNSTQRGYGSRWEADRKAFLARRENQICRWVGCGQAATHVDHIIPHRGEPRLRDDPKNWQGLCAHHHNSAKQRLERRSSKRT